jgi:hypothetical protein
MYYRGSGVRSTGRAGICVAILAIVALGVLAACQPEAGTRTITALPGVPTPTDAIVDLGGGSAAIDGDRQFVAYSSNALPATALKRFDAQLKAAGYRSVGRRTGWTCYVRGSGNWTGDVVLVYVEPDGPPTTLLIAAGTFADIALANGRGQTDTGTSGLGTPDPTSAIKSHPPRGRGSGGGKGNANGNGGQGSGGGSDKDTKPKPSPAPKSHSDQPEPNARP